MEIVLTARSGKHAFEHVTKKLGYDITEAQLPAIYSDFLQMADQKKEIYDNDIIDLLDSYPRLQSRFKVSLWKLEDFQVVYSNMPGATVKLRQGEETILSSENGDGAVDALYSAIINAVKMPLQLIEYRIHNLSRGKESLGKVTLQIQYKDKLYHGKSVERDVMKASALALINAINKTILE